MQFLQGLQTSNSYIDMPARKSFADIALEQTPASRSLPTAGQEKSPASKSFADVAKEQKKKEDEDLFNNLMEGDGKIGSHRMALADEEESRSKQTNS